MGLIDVFKLLVAVHLPKKHAVRKPGGVKFSPRDIKILRKILENTVIHTLGRWV